MNNSTHAAPDQGKDQRDALKQSEKNASEEQPGSFKDQETDEKVVRVDPIGGGTDDAIKGIDPDSKPKP